MMSSTAGAILERGLKAPVERQILAAAAWTVFVLFVGLSLVLLARRLSGALVVSPGSGGLVAISLVLALVTTGLRQVLATGGQTPATAYFVRSTGYLNSFWVLVCFALPGLAAICFLAALTSRGSPVSGTIASWFILAGSEVANWLVLFRQPRRLWQQEGRPTAAAFLTGAEPEAESIAGLVQQITRIQEAGAEAIRAIMQVEVVMGDRLGVGHIAFCPPLAAVPQLTAHAIDADDAEVRVTQAESFGARIEVRLPAATTAARQLLVEIIGRAPITGSAG